MIVRAALLSVIILVHDWYPSYCCGGGDCHPVPCEELRHNDQPSRNGKAEWFWKEHGPFDNVESSPDGQCHVCVYKHPYQPKPQPKCIFIPRNLTS